MATAYGYVNVAYHNRKPDGDERWFATRGERNASMLALRERAQKDGLSKSAANAGIYPISGPRTDALALEIESAPSEGPRRPRGRPPTADGARPHQIVVRLSEAENAALLRLCHRDDLSPSDAVRAAILALDSAR